MTNLQGDSPNRPSISTEIAQPAIGIALIPLALIEGNPWQTRIDDDPAHVRRVAEDIQARAAADPDDPQMGLLQAPTARPHPTEYGRYQLAFGHTRLAAFKYLTTSPDDGPRWEHFPLIIRRLGDRDMAEMAARENAARKDLTAIETAKAMQRLIKDFGLSQLDAGKIFGYNSQGAVSNLLRLLELPARIQDHVHRGTLPERLARQLLPVMHFDVQQAEEIAERLAGMRDDDGQRDPMCRSMIVDFYSKKGKSLDYPPFALDWPKKPIPTPEDLVTKKTPAELRACVGCEYRVQGRYGSETCMQPACFTAKAKLHAAREARRVSKTLDIPVLAEGESYTVVYAGGYDGQDAAKAALAAGHDSLRIIPSTKNNWETWQTNQVLGSKHVALATVDPDAL
ncbi:MAG: ParB/RepB/Spo0J family partition protein, partial [Chloroflexi bacterium]|nr:ParB/RepB/Spo0J family partition protein [Chloroflexota bacterium]